MTKIHTNGDWLLDDLYQVADNTLQHKFMTEDKQNQTKTSAVKRWLCKWICCKKHYEEQSKFKIEHYYLDFRCNALNIKIQPDEDGKDVSKNKSMTNFRVANDIFNAINKEEVQVNIRHYPVLRHIIDEQFVATKFYYYMQGIFQMILIVLFYVQIKYCE